MLKCKRIFQKVANNPEHRNRRFFDNISSYYRDLIKKRSLQWMKTVVEPRMGGKVLDVGNGGVREFFPPVTSLYVGVDSSLEMLKKGDETTQKVCCEATSLAFKEGVFDTLFYQSLLHHLATRDMKRTMEVVKTTLQQGATCLKKEGNVMIIEPCLPVFLEWIERIFFFYLQIFFSLTGQSEVFLFSSGTLTRSLEESGFREIKVWEERMGEQSPWNLITPFIGLPFLKIPRWMNTSRRTILEAKKGE